MSRRPYQEDATTLDQPREDLGQRSARIAEIERAHRQLEQLYEISKLLTSFDSVQRTVPEVLSVVAETLRLRNAVFIVREAGAIRTTVWQADDESAAHVQAAEGYARAVYDYLARAGAGPPAAADPRGFERPQWPASSEAAQSEARKQLMHLPLAVDHGGIFGGLQLEGRVAFDERDLIFVNAVANQLAIAVARLAATEARQAAAETGAREQRLLAQVGAAVASSLDSRAIFEAIARSAVPLFADLCLIDDARGDSGVQPIAAIFADDEQHRQVAERLRRLFLPPGWTTPLSDALAAGKPLLLQGITDPVAQDERHAALLRAAGVHSMIVAPLLARGRGLGTIAFATATPGRCYTARDLALAEEIARVAALATDNASLYEQAQRATRAREDLLAVVSHDLKSPLSSVLMGITFLRELPDDEYPRQARKHLERVDRSAKRMHRLIEDLLVAANIEGGGFTVTPTSLEVAPQIAETLEVMQPLATSDSVRLESELPAGLPRVSADAQRLQQVLTNLLGNAIKFTPAGGTIAVRARASDAEVTFSVSDTGRGIPPEDVPRLFHRFWQSRLTARLGTGLGLFIVKGIVQAHAGRVWVESEVGVGSTFSFTLPVAPPCTDRPEPGPARDARPPVSTDAHGADVDTRTPQLEAVIRELELRKRQLHTAFESTRVARELAEEAGVFKRDLVALVSHELRGPLTAIELLIERMSRDPVNPPTPEQQQVIQRMFAATARLSAMIESLLGQALIQSGRLALHVEAFNPRAVAAEVIEELRPCAERKGLELRLVAASDLPSLTSDPELVRLILLNLVGNAVRFTEHGEVVIAIAAEAGVHSLAVCDSGPGIAPADRVRIFEPFTQGVDARQKHLPGMGLGLALVQEVTSALGGHIELDSELGRGSTFMVALPPAATPLHRAAPLH